VTILAWDFETSGLPDFKARSADPKQPHIVSMALCHYADDGTEIEATSVIVRPDGWVISPEMTAIHGISHERAMDVGIPENDVIDLYVTHQGRSRVKVAHNAQFDIRIARIAMTRAGYERDFIESVEARASFCTCNTAKPIVNLPPTEKMVAAGFNGPKSPNLAECIQYFFGEELEGAHDALIDARACARIYFALKTRIATGAPA
jgi:DNA polymerase III subunit epsilon